MLFIINYDISIAQSPNWDWVNGAGGNDTEMGNAVAVDNAGNVYVTGRFQTFVLNLGPDVLYNIGEDDTFVIKYGPNGNMLWARSMGGVSGDVGKALATDADGNVYIGGNFSSPALVFDVNDTLLNSYPGYNNIFLAKYDANGNLLWYKQEGERNIVLTDIAIDDTANLYITGSLSNPMVIFETDTLYNFNASGGSSDIFIVKIDSAGNDVWAMNEGAIQSEYATSISLDPNGNILITGGFEFGYFIFGNDTLENPSYDTDDIFVVKLANDGSPIWAKRAGAVNDADEWGNSITSDQDGNVLVTGSFKGGTIYFGTTPLVNTDNSGNTHDIFIAKYGSNGNLIWVKKAGGSYWDYGNTIATDNLGHIYVSGSFHSFTIAFGLTTLNNTLATYKDMYIVCYDTAGTALWTKKAGGNDYEECLDMMVDPTGYVYLTGHYSSLSTMFDTYTLNSSPVGSGNLFTAKLHYPTMGFEEVNDELEIAVFPNPFSTQLFIECTEDFKDATLLLENNLGQIITKLEKVSGHQIMLNRDELPSGIYFIYVKDGSKSITKKIIVSN